jgi:hypothetical protein
MRAALWPIAAVSIAACGERAANGSGAVAAHNVKANAQVAVALPPGPDSAKIRPTSELAVAALLPMDSVDTAMPVTARVVHVPRGANLQRALNAAVSGDELVLAAGAAFTGNFVLPARGCAGGWVVVRGETVPVAAGQRMRPSLAGPLPKLRTPNGQPALSAAPGACKWRLVALEVTHLSPLPVDEQYGLVALGEGDASAPPSDVVLDRLYVHGATADANVRRGVALNGARQAVVDSWIADVHSRGTDSQAIAGWGGAGPYLIRDNYLEAAGENIMFGGSDPGVDGLVPSDITVTGNHFFKSLSWKGGPWQVKNLLELKNAQRVLVEGNVFQNSWAAAQDGWAFIWASHNQYGGSWGAWSVVRDVTFRYNRVDNVEGGFNLAERYDASATSGARFTIAQNLITNVGFSDSGDLDRLFLVSGNLADVAIEHNTGFAPTAYLQFGDQSPTPKPRMTFRNNLGGNARYTYNSPLGDGAGMFSSYGIDLSGVTGSCIATSEPSIMPNGNVYQTSLSALGIVNPSGFSGDYRLSSSSPCRGRATDGSDPGVDIATLMSKTARSVVQ